MYLVLFLSVYFVLLTVADDVGADCCCRCRCTRYHHAPSCTSRQAEGAYTAAGTWAASAEEAKLIEELADADEKWEALLEERADWLNPPVQPEGLQDGACCFDFYNDSLL